MRPRRFEVGRGKWHSRVLAAARSGNILPFLAGVTITTALLGGVVMRFLDRDSFPSIWDGIWFALQTVTTVGYGDIVPGSAWGKVVGGFVMVAGVSFISLSTAMVVSVFVGMEQRRSAEVAVVADEAERREILDAIGSLEHRLAAIEA
jgi:voltage-gated potassium channel